MRDRFFEPGPLADALQHGETLMLSDSVAHHVSRVLRMQPGARLTLFNGDGYAYQACIVTSDKKATSVRIDAADYTPRTSPLHSHLFQCISKGDRMDFALRKAVECGVSAITPVISQFSEFKLNSDRAQKKQQHWQHIIISACEQCGLNRVPALHPPITLDQALTQADGLQLALHPATATPNDKVQSVNLRDIAHQPTVPERVSLLIGPEGGLSEDEVRRACSQGFYTLSLGPRILRTETAPIAALSVLQFLFGDYAATD